MVYHAQQMSVIVHHQNRMYLVIVHDILNLGNLGIRRHAFRRTCHHLLHRDVEELVLQTFHGAPHIAVRYQPDYLIIYHRHTQT